MWVYCTIIIIKTLIAGSLFCAVFRTSVPPKDDSLQHKKEEENKQQIKSMERMGSILEGNQDFLCAAEVSAQN